MTVGTLAGRARSRRFPRFRRPRGRWLVLSLALAVGVAGTVTGLALTSGGTGPDQGSWPQMAVFSADGRYLVTAGLTGAQVIDPASGRVLAEWKPVLPPGRHVTAIGMRIGISQDDRTIVTDNSGYVMRWSTASVLAAGVGGHPRPLSVFLAGTPREGTLDDSLSADGALVAVDDFDGHVTVWNTATGRVAARVNGITTQAGLGRFSPDDRVLAGAADRGADDGEVALWDISAKTPGLLRVLADRTAGPVLVSGPLYPPVFTPENGLEVARPDGAVTRLLDDATGRQLAVLPQAGIPVLSSFVISRPAGLTAEGNAPLYGWVTVRAASGRVLARVAPPQATSDLEDQSVTGLVFSPDGKTLVIVSLEGPARLWQVPGTAPR